MRNRNPRAGSALIEAAAVLPVFALLLCGSLDIARTFQLSQVTVSAARAGTHHALQGDPHTLDLQALEGAAMKDAAIPGLTAKASRLCACAVEDPAVPCERAKCGTLRASYLRLETSIEMKPFIRYPGMASPYTVRGEALVRVE